MSESIWQADRDWAALGGHHPAMAGTELPAIGWARAIKSELVRLQRETRGRIPAGGAITQFIHESFNPGGLVMSRLAAEFNQLAGMKWVGGWQLRHGGRPVSMTTWEEVDGERQDLVDAFCAFPSVGHFLEAYSELLHFERYRRAHAYGAQPLLWLHQVWAGGWATDSRYLGGLGHWMAATWPIYGDTVERPPEPGKPVPILVDGQEVATGRIVQVDGSERLDLVTPLSNLLEDLGIHRDSGYTWRPDPPGLLISTKR